MRYIYLLIMVLAFSVNANAEDKIDQEKVDQFVIGKTTVSEVVSALGHPTYGLEEKHGGGKIARYSFRGFTRGLFVNTYEPTTTTFIFDENSILISYSTIEMAKREN